MHRQKCSIPNLPDPNNVTISDQHVNDYVRVMKDTTANYNTRLDAQNKLETILVDRGTCQALNPDIFDDMKVKVFNIDDVKLQGILNTTQGLNADLHADISCAVNAILYQQQDIPSLSRERVRHWFKNIKQIDTKSSEGYIFNSSPSDDSNIFVLKTPREVRDDDLIHEVLVGFYGLNTIRHIVPNFMYVYGYTKCSAPIISNGEIHTWCSSYSKNSKYDATYVILENIIDSVTLFRFLISPDTTNDDFLAVFLQIVNALNIAYKKVNFTHYDLHTSNILVRKYKEPIAVAIYDPNGDFMGYVVTKFIPYIIDYGYSTITIDGIEFGKLGLSNVGVTSKPYPMYDVYKLLGFLGMVLLHTQNNKSRLFRIISDLFKFFNEEDLRTRVRMRVLNPHNDYFNISSGKEHITHDDYIEWMLNSSGVIFPLHKQLPEYAESPIDIPFDTCQFNKLVKRRHGDQMPLEYCNYINHIENSLDQNLDLKYKLISDAAHDFDPRVYFNNIKSTIYDAMDISYKMLNLNTIPDLKDINPNSLYDTQEYYDKVVAIAQVKDSIVILTTTIEQTKCAYEKQGHNTDELVAILQQLDKLNRKYTKAKRQIITNYTKLSRQKWHGSKELHKFWGNTILEIIYAL